MLLGSTPSWIVKGLFTCAPPASLSFFETKVLTACCVALVDEMHVFSQSFS